MSLIMRIAALVLACSTDVCYGLRNPISSERWQSSAPAESQNSLEVVNRLKVLASYLLAFNPALRINPTASGAPSLALDKQYQVGHLSRTNPGMNVAVMEKPAADDSTKADKPMSAEEFRDLHRITLKGGDTDRYEPIHTLDETPFDPAIKEVFKKEGFKKPTPIQSLSWPIALAGRDVVNIAKTGSGKTLAYLMPIFHRYMMDAANGRGADGDVAAGNNAKVDSPVSSAAAEADALGAQENQSIAEVTRAVEIPAKLVEPFQGHNGENFKKLKKKTGCVSIELANESSVAEAADRRIIIKGAADNVEAARTTLVKAIKKKADSPKMLVLAPTRELASQITEEAYKYAPIVGIRAMRLVGGATRKEQQIFLMRTIRPDLIVATPGRCVDLIETGELRLHEVQYLVLDEADRMLELGFEPQIRQIVRKLPDKGQAMMYSATWPEKVRFLSSQLLSDPVISSIGDGDTSNANKAITQHVKVVANKSMKEPELFSLLDDINDDEEKHPNNIPKMLIFVDKRRKCADLAAKLGEKGYKVHTMHSRMQAHVRTKVMNRFRRGELRVLVTTDLASRGLDVTDVEVVINYDMPEWKVAAENYVHRIGRTARGDREGRSFTFLTKADKKAVKPLIGVLERAGQEVPEEVRAMLERKPNPYRLL